MHLVRQPFWWPWQCAGAIQTALSNAECPGLLQKPPEATGKQATISGGGGRGGGGGGSDGWWGGWGGGGRKPRRHRRSWWGFLNTHTFWQLSDSIRAIFWHPRIHPSPKKIRRIEVPGGGFICATNKKVVSQYTSVYSAILLPWGHSLHHFYCTHIMSSLLYFFATFSLP